MDYNNSDKEPWDWHGKDYCLQKTSNFEISEELWIDVPQNGEDLSYMLDDETTPVKGGNTYLRDAAFIVGTYFLCNLLSFPRESWFSWCYLRVLPSIVLVLQRTWKEDFDEFCKTKEIHACQLCLFS